MILLNSNIFSSQNFTLGFPIFRMLGGGGPDKMEQAMAMAAQNPHLEAENTKDFLALWTKMAVTCFERCVTNTQNSMIDPNSKEFSCVENCVGKVILF